LNAASCSLFDNLPKKSSFPQSNRRGFSAGPGAPGWPRPAGRGRENGPAVRHYAMVPGGASDTVKFIILFFIIAICFLFVRFADKKYLDHNLQ
jgi:hypothetical protein